MNKTKSRIIRTPNLRDLRAVGLISFIAILAQGAGIASAQSAEFLEQYSTGELMTEIEQLMTDDSSAYEPVADAEGSKLISSNETDLRNDPFTAGCVTYYSGTDKCDLAFPNRGSQVDTCERAKDEPDIAWNRSTIGEVSSWGKKCFQSYGNWRIAFHDCRELCKESGYTGGRCGSFLTPACASGPKKEAWAAECVCDRPGSNTNCKCPVSTGEKILLDNCGGVGDGERCPAAACFVERESGGVDARRCGSSKDRAPE